MHLNKNKALSNGLICTVWIVLLCLSAGSAVGATTPTDGIVSENSSVGSAPQTNESEISPAVSNASGTVEAVIRLDGDLAPTKDTNVTELRTHARTSSQPLRRYIQRSDDVTLLKELWITNALLIEIDADSRALARISSFDRVKRIHSNFELYPYAADDVANGTEATTGSSNETSTEPTPDKPNGTSTEVTANASNGKSTEATAGESNDTHTETTVGGNVSDGDPTGPVEPDNRSTSTSTVGESTESEPTEKDASTQPQRRWGVEYISTAAAWEQFDTKGKGVKVAVLDTGVDPSHPDIELYTIAESDETYPGGWAEFNSTGGQIPGSVPHDDSEDGHGTHVSGIVAGGDANGTYVGVSPNAKLMHGMVLGDSGATFGSVAGGIQWAVEEDAGVIVLSLGATTYERQMIESVRNARSTGTVVVAASGDRGQGSSSSPANVYEAFSVGATDQDGEVLTNSSGERITTGSAWSDDHPREWPDTYVVPDVSAPGKNIRSTALDGGYRRETGTSMATPHVAGAVALIQSATERRLPPSAIESAIEQTARDPIDDRADPQYGHGILDVNASVARAQNGVTGTVTSNGIPVDGAVVDVVGGPRIRTGDDGNFTIPLAPGSYELEVFGRTISNETIDITVSDGTYSEVSVEPRPALEAGVIEDQPELVGSGDTIRVNLGVDNLESMSVATDPESAAGNTTLRINGHEHVFGERIDFDAYSGTVTITVETSAPYNGTVRLESTLEGRTERMRIETGPTTVAPSITDVAVVGTRSGYGDEVAQSIDHRLPSNYSVETVSARNVDDAVGEYDVFVVNRFLTTESAEAFMTEAGPGTGIVLLEQGGPESNAISQVSEAFGWPEGTSQRPGAGTVRYSIEANHPVIADVGPVGETVPIHDADISAQSWFTGATGATTVASVGDEESTAGPALAVDEANNTVLASSLGRGRAVPDGTYTNASNLILANAVEYTVRGEGGEQESNATAANVSVGDVVAPVDGRRSVRLRTGANGVAGYQARVSYDPSVVTVTDVRGVDATDPVYRDDESSGVVSLAQANATAMDDPTLAEITFEVTGETNESTVLALDPDATLVNDVAGNEIPTSVRNGSIMVSNCGSGDVDRDGAVTSGDATLTQRHIVGQSVDDAFDERCADLTGDGKVTSADVTAILQEIVGAQTGNPA